MPIKTIKLGKMSGPYSISPPEMPPQEEHFPGLHLELPEGAELPDNGVLTIRYRVNREVEDKREGTCCVDLDVTEILDVKDETDKKEEYAGDVLDKLRADSEDEGEE